MKADSPLMEDGQKMASNEVNFKNGATLPINRLRLLEQYCNFRKRMVYHRTNYGYRP